MSSAGNHSTSNDPLGYAETTLNLQQVLHIQHQGLGQTLTLSIQKIRPKTKAVTFILLQHQDPP